MTVGGEGGGGGRERKEKGRKKEKRHQIRHLHYAAAKMTTAEPPNAQIKAEKKKHRKSKTEDI